MKPEDIRCPVVYHLANTRKIAEEGEEPTFKFKKLDTRRPELYADCNYTRTEDGGKIIGIEGEPVLGEVLDSRFTPKKWKKNLTIQHMGKDSM